MALEVEPSARGLLVVIGVVLFILLAMQSSGALMTLTALAIIVAIILLLVWAAGVRLGRFLTGAS